MVKVGTLVLFILVAVGSLILYYILTSKRRRKPFYHEEDEWRANTPGHSQEIMFSVFLIGDAGAPSFDPPEPNLQILKQQLLKAGKDSAVCFLGDNIYPRGLPEPTHPLHAIAEQRLLGQLEILREYKGKICFISGNHDWNKGRPGGWKSMMRQQAYVDAYFNRKDIYLPRNGCPGPVEMPLTEHLTAIIINTQWWVHGGRKPLGKEYGCSVENENDFYVQLERMLEKNKGKKLLVVGHHPMYSRAYHGGNFNLKQHLFPLTELNKKMYVPFPLVGSIYPMYRKYIGSREDMAHPRYRKMRKRLISIFSRYPDLVYAAGHDHNLQYIKKGAQHYIVSGAGCKINYVQGGDGALFTHAHKGFFRLDYYTNGDIWAEVWEPGKTGRPLLAYRKELHDNDPKPSFVNLGG